MEELSSATTDRFQTEIVANALAQAIDARDTYTHSHSRTVSHLCALVAGELGFDPDRVRQVRLAGLLHDVGKVGVADGILKKPGRLTTDEFAQMQQHSTLGAKIIAAANLDGLSNWVRHVHERFDGAGYPDRLTGNEIPLEARIIFVCDAYEAMTADRPYRKAPGHGFAIAELQRHAGSQFDPDVVGAFLRGAFGHGTITGTGVSPHA